MRSLRRTTRRETVSGFAMAVAARGYHPCVRRIIDTLGGLWELLLLAVKTRFRLRGCYWRWRYETAFGTDASRMPSPRERRRAMLHYGIWVYRTKRGR